MIRHGQFAARRRAGAAPAHARHLAAALLAAAFAAGAAVAQIPEISETIEVRVVNVDVVVTDERGVPVTGLGVDDFELVVDGETAGIDYFAAYGGPAGARAEEAAGGAPAEPGPGSTEPLGPEEPSLAQRPWLVVAVEGRGLRPTDVRPALDEMRAALGGMIASARSVMVVRQGMSLVVAQPFTRDRGLLDAALERIGAKPTPAVDVGGRNLIIRRIESADPPQSGVFEAQDDRILFQAENLLREVRSQAEIERAENVAAARQLRGLVRSLAGLPGRKAVLYLGRGLQARPAEPLFRLWWAKYRTIADELGVFSIEAEMGLNPIASELLDLILEANSLQVVFYAYDPGGLRTIGATAEFSSLEAVDLAGSEILTQQDSLMALSRGTGGLGQVNLSSLKPLIDQMTSGFEAYYSLGFEPRPDARERGKIEVHARHRGYRLRHLRRYVTRTPATRLEEVALAALLTEVAENPLEVGVELGEPERQRDGTYVVPMLVKVPMARLALVPEAASHVGRLSVVVIAESAHGELSAPAHSEVPIEIANGELLGALGGMAGYRLRMRVSPGEQRIAIGVRDDVALATSVINLVVHTGREG